MNIFSNIYKRSYFDVRTDSGTGSEETHKKPDFKLNIDRERNKLITPAGYSTIDSRYLQHGEDFQDMVARLAKAYANDEEHAQRLYDYISMHWFMPATPVLSNGGTNRGLPISCFLNETDDSLEGIINLWTESAWLAASGGGVGSYWGEVRSIGEEIKAGGQTSGIIPFIAVEDKMSIAVSQGGSLRRGSIAVYLPIWHPEIREFLQIRRPTGGDMNRKSLNIHHAIVIEDKFMQAVEEDSTWDLVSPKDRSVIETVKARELWIEILTMRLETGEPYIIFIDNVNRLRPEIYKKLNLEVKTSNLCSEITLATGPDHLGEQRTAVCCLSSLNLEYYDSWKHNKQFLYDVFAFIDNVLQDFIDRAPDVMSKARYSAMRERSVGIGVMGFASLLQKRMVPFNSKEASDLNDEIFSKIKKEADHASQALADLKGACLDAKEAGLNERFTHKLAIAPTASISIIAGNCSPGIEPYIANAYTQKTLAGSLAVRNKFLKEVLARHKMDTDDVWSKIITNNGSVQNLHFLSQAEKDVFKTAYEIDQEVLINLAADRTKYICQAQSLNLFLSADVHKKILHNLHFNAWKKGVKSLYYCRSMSIQRAEKVSTSVNNDFIENKNGGTICNDEICIACQ
jgi:ribonucleoside-diphosphate reductase alpha chain